MTNEEVTVWGPKASRVMSLRVDTGARNTIIPASVAQRLGLPNLGNASVATYGLDVRWIDSKGYVSLPGTRPIEVPIWVAPDGAVPALGESAMAALGYKIVRPAQNWSPTPLQGPYAGAAQALQAPQGPADFSYEANRAVCHGCEYYRPGGNFISQTIGLFSEEKGSCSECGCPIATRARTHCRIGRF